MYLPAAVQWRLPSAVYKGVCQPQSNGARGARFTNALRDFFPEQSARDRKNLRKSRSRLARIAAGMGVSPKQRKNCLSPARRLPRPKKPVAETLATKEARRKRSPWRRTRNKRSPRRGVPQRKNKIFCYFMPIALCAACFVKRFEIL